MQVLKVKIKPKVDRLDQFVASEVKNLSRSKAKKLIKEGFIVVNDAQVDPSYKVQKGDSVKIEIPASPEVSLRPESIPMEIIFEDSEILVINKQAGLVVHPTIDHPTGTLVNALLGHLGKFSEQTDLRPGIVHRLDKDTSGVIIVAKTERALDNLKGQFKGRKVRKKYLALVQGEVIKEVGEVSTGIDRHPKFKTKFIASDTGREAQTLYKVLERFGRKFTLLELELHTGRTHQLRVHLSFLGHPIIGDKLYGGKMLLPRQFLHAWKIEFTHPSTKQLLSFEAKLPPDLENLLGKLRENNSD